MKTLLLAISSFLLTLACSAQYTVLLNFNSQGATTSGVLTGSLNLSGNKLYGMSQVPGTVFNIDTNGNGYNDFSVGYTSFPNGSLLLSGKKMYGMTIYTGTDGDGYIFAMDTNGNNLKDLHDFNDTNGAYGYGSLIRSGSKLYGMTAQGGESTNPFVKFLCGTIFSIDTNGTGYQVLHYFNDTAGQNPQADLTLIGNKLYGMATAGGTANQGVIFSMNTNGTGYKVLYNFLGPLTGQGPQGNLTLIRNKFYGTTWGAGDGNIFSIDTNGNGYSILFSFSGTNGSNPYGSLTLSGAFMFGMTQFGGANNQGVIFAIDTNGNRFTDLHDFLQNSIDSLGENPQGNLTISGNTLYGMATAGGFYQNGVVFSFKIPTNLGVNQLASSKGLISTYPNPSNGVFNIRGQGLSGKNDIMIYNMLGQQIFTGNLNSNTTTEIDLNSQPNGVYCYRVITEDGNSVSNGKIIIAK